MVYLTYMLSELRRRRGRTLLTALGLGLGVGLVIAVGALSAGLDRAQATVLEPLTGVGTDMSVTRPIEVSGDPRTTFQQLSPEEREQLRKELGGPGRIDFGDLKPGSTFSQTVYRASQLSFPASAVTTIGALAGVDSAAGALTLSVSTISGTVPDVRRDGGGFRTRVGPRPGGGRAGNAAFAATTVTGVDPAQTALGPVAESRLAGGRWFSDPDAREAILDAGFARTKGKSVGDTIAVGTRRYDVVGLVKTPLGGQSSDVYVQLAQLQELSGRSGRVNAVYVRAKDAKDVSALARHIRGALPGASVTTAKTLADRVTGSLADARSVTEKLGLAL
jgi:ABC-type antimicrobial peptide transport system permease subunit